MSFSRQGRASASSALPQTEPRHSSDRASTFPLLDKSRETDELNGADKLKLLRAAVQNMQTRVADIQKQTRQLNAPNASTSLDTMRSKVEDAKTFCLESENLARRLLSASADDMKGLPMQEKALQEAKMRKLTESLDKSAVSLRTSLAEFDERHDVVQADAERARAIEASAASTVTASAASTATASASRQDGYEASTSPLDDAIQVERSEVSLQDIDIGQADVDHHGSIVAEFTRDVSNVQSDMSALSDVVQTMASLTQDQGHVLDNIESCLSNTEAQAEGAHEQIAQASETQSTGVKRIWWFLLAAVIAAIVMVLFLLNSGSKSKMTHVAGEWHHRQNNTVHAYIV